MKEKLRKAVEALTKKSEKAEKAIDAQQFAQAVLSLTHALRTLEDVK